MMKGGCFLVIALLLCFAACSTKVDEGVIGTDEMTDILYDFHLAQALDRGQSGRDYKSAVLAKHGVSEAEFDSALVWYTKNNDILFGIYKEINQRYEKEIAGLGDYSAINSSSRKLTLTGDTANIWRGKETYILSPTLYGNKMYFVQGADTAINASDKIEWNFNARFIYPSGTKAAIVVFAVRYDNDSTQMVSRRLFSDGEQSLLMQTANRRVKEVYGHIYLDDKVSNAVKLLVIDNISLVRYKNKKVVTDMSPKVDSLTAKDTTKLEVKSPDSLTRPTTVEITNSPREENGRGH